MGVTKSKKEKKKDVSETFLVVICIGQTMFKICLNKKKKEKETRLHNVWLSYVLPFWGPYPLLFYTSAKI